jgi:phosphohistidine phosphatase
MTDNSNALVYLVRHGEAMPKEEDPERPLTAAGRDDVSRMAAWAATTGNHVAAIQHSGKLRAQQTAQIFADHLPEAPIPEAVSGLAPNDDVKPIANQLRSEVHPIMLVGHLPFLERLASLLVAGNADAPVVTLDAGALLALAKDEDGWSAVCLMQPRYLPAP